MEIIEMLKRIEELLKERGHSDPQTGIKNVQFQMKPMTTQEVFEAIINGDDYIRRHLTTEINHSLSQFMREGEVGQRGLMTVKPFDMNWSKTKYDNFGNIELSGTVNFLKPGLDKKIPFTCSYYPNEGYIADIDIMGTWY